MRKWLAFALASRCRADADTDSVKSINLRAAPPVRSYTLQALSQLTLEDPHPVHGTATSDSGYVLVGKALEASDLSKTEAFAVKLDRTGEFLWGWTSGVSGNDVANSVVQLPTGEIIVAGYRVVSGTALRSLTRLDLNTGAEAWTATFADEQQRHGAWESVRLLQPFGTEVLLAGLHAKADAEGMQFKSYGNVAGGNALVQRLPVTALSYRAPPTVSDVSWSWSSTAYSTAKAAVPLPGGDVAALLYNELQHASLVRLTPAAVASWGPTDYASSHGEGTDLVVAADGDLAITGHGGDGATLSGRLSKVRASDGGYLWTRSYSAGGNPRLIFNECFGLQPMSDGGFALSCGAGIESCDPGYNPALSDAALRADCDVGRGDTRAGAALRPAGAWQSLLIRTDASGELLWQRVDSYRDPSDTPAGSAAQPHSSACEYVIGTSDGSLVGVQDEVTGVGLLILGPASASSPQPPLQPASSSASTDSEFASMTASLPSRFPRGYMRGWSAGYAAGFEEGRARDKAGQTASRNVGAVTWTHAAPPTGATEATRVEAGRRAVDDQIAGLAKDYDASLNILRSRAPNAAAMEPTGAELAKQLAEQSGWQYPQST